MRCSENHWRRVLLTRVFQLLYSFTRSSLQAYVMTLHCWHPFLTYIRLNQRFSAVVVTQSLTVYNSTEYTSNMQTLGNHFQQGVSRSKKSSCIMYHDTSIFMSAICNFFSQLQTFKLASWPPDLTWPSRAPAKLLFVGHSAYSSCRRHLVFGLI